ncbi:MAG TPA: Uma2 family endonuclease [Candidatus Obscuribacterales bacterium]
MAAIPRQFHTSCRLHNGDRMTRAEFHRVYSAMPEDYRAELIAGMVFEPSPVSYPHGKVHSRLGHLFEVYTATTPGTEIAVDATVMLSEEDEVQPDLMLRIVRESGGRSWETPKHYIEGAPELVAEVAYSSRAIDLHLKKERYALAGVLEYMVVCLRPKHIYWFDLCNNSLIESGDDGIFRSLIFPGLWIHGKGLLDLNYKLTNDALARGLQTGEHQSFLARLAKGLK